MVISVRSAECSSSACGLFLSLCVAALSFDTDDRIRGLLLFSEIVSGNCGKWYLAKFSFPIIYSFMRIIDASIAIESRGYRLYREACISIIRLRKITLFYALGEELFLLLCVR